MAMERKKLTLYSEALYVTALVPLLNPAMTPPGSMAMPLRIAYFAIGMVGTIVMTFCNGILIGWFGKQMHQYFVVVPRWGRLAKKFDLS